jgi:hypothetical protein
MKHPFFLACFLLAFLPASAKTDELSAGILRRLPAFSTGRILSFADSINSGTLRSPAVKKIWRVETDSSQLIGDYWEISFTFYAKSKNSEEKKNVLLLQTAGDAVICAVLDNAQLFERRQVLFDSTSAEGWERLSAAWKKAYGVALEKSAFLYPVDAYGEACGFVPIPPVRRGLMLDFVAKKDVASLTAWLQSPIADKQCYAVEGFFRLKEAGLALTEEQLAMIREAQKRQALVTRCAGCIYGIERQDIVLGGFLF